MGYLFGVSDSTVSRIIQRVLPILEQSGRDTMWMPDPGRKRRRKLDQLRQDTPRLAAVIDSFEQKVQRPQDPNDRDRCANTIDLKQTAPTTAKDGIINDKPTR